MNNMYVYIYIYSYPVDEIDEAAKLTRFLF